MKSAPRKREGTRTLGAVRSAPLAPSDLHLAPLAGRGRRRRRRERGTAQQSEGKLLDAEVVHLALRSATCDSDQFPRAQRSAPLPAATPPTSPRKRGEVNQKRNRTARGDRLS